MNIEIIWSFSKLRNLNILFNSKLKQKRKSFQNAQVDWFSFRNFPLFDCFIFHRLHRKFICGILTSWLFFYCCCVLQKRILLVFFLFIFNFPSSHNFHKKKKNLLARKKRLNLVAIYFQFCFWFFFYIIQ